MGGAGKFAGSGRGAPLRDQGTPAPRAARARARRGAPRERPPAASSFPSSERVADRDPTGFMTRRQPIPGLYCGRPLTGGSNLLPPVSPLAYRGWGTIRMYGFGDFQPPGYACLASASETAGTMMTSSPCFQFTGVATLCLAVSWQESRSRSTSSKLRPVLIGEGSIALTLFFRPITDTERTVALSAAGRPCAVVPESSGSMS